jgi:hypothetical protein
MDVRNHIITEDERTPEDIQKRYYSNRGVIYGIVSDRRKNKGLKAPQKSGKNTKTSGLSGTASIREEECRWSFSQDSRSGIREGMNQRNNIHHLFQTYLFKILH